ncbi:MAG: hypothetical protein HC840_24500 [Leptolyngbyaceae cyanobacterium RM2_2_4]|nr:hypothetical protein [Leptolyngbyaceae cyanobacterium SM1_4_3]NJN89408.1 hypothetical protein [Leptolyngbyaceae cyanobacterium SL_5_14]NJO52044.1 hypothetical protein [Leptolyngbyaceae cyanobacterium RM2_2_4]
MQEGRQEGQREFVENLLRARFGSLDEDLAGIIEAVLDLPPAESAPLLLQLSREGLLARFRQS